MVKIKIIRGDFEKVIHSDPFYESVYSLVNRLNDGKSYNDGSFLFEGVGRYSDNPGDYQFRESLYGYQALTKLVQIDRNPLILSSVSNNWRLSRDRYNNYSILFGLNIKLQDQSANIVLGAKRESLEEEIESLSTSGSYWDNIQIKKANDGEVNSEMEFFGDYPCSIPEYVSRGLLDRVYQNILIGLELRQGKVKFVYPEGRHSIPVLVPGAQKGRYLFC